MVKKYDIKDNIAAVQNTLINESIRETANIQLLKSEEAIRNVLESYAEKFNTTGGKLTNMAKHYVTTRNLINSKSFNELFNSLYIDLKTLYTELDYVDKILSLNLERNKKFFGILKKRTKELWDKLDITRMSVSELSQFDESYFEGFSAIGSQHVYFDVDLNKKTGKMTLAHSEKKFQNKSYLIKSITSKTYPVHNDTGGVIFTTNPLNSFEYNYGKDGPRDMLENGLWKEQIFCSDVPNITYDIKNNTASPLYKHYNGIVSLIDIEYVYPVEINNIDIDVFGEYETSILGILVRNSTTEVWTPVKKLKTVKNYSNYYDFIDNFDIQSEFDIISLTNLELVKVQFVRIVLGQNNYEVLDSNKITVVSTKEKINEDLAERRYEIVKLDGGSDDKPAKPKVFSTDSLYIKITDIIEETRSIEETITKILNVLDPKLKLVDINFEKTLKYEIGAWSIEPMSIKYNGTGKFDSGSYFINNKSLLSVSLNTSQEDIKETTCNWYVSNKDNQLFVPIIENKRTIRKEPAFIIRPQYYKDLGWEGYFIHLDFPIDQTSIAATRLYINGELINLSSLTYHFFNSTMLYIANITDNTKNNYVIQYIPYIYSTISVYTVEKNEPYDFSKPYEYEIVAPTKSVLDYFLHKNNLEKTYSIKKSWCNKFEYDRFFPNNKNICISPSVNNAFVTTMLNKNIVTNFKSIGYNSSIAQGIDKNFGGSVIPAIPIKIWRNI